MPKQLTKTDGTNLKIDSLFYRDKKEEIEKKLKEFTDIYGIRLKMRSDLDTALRMYILANTDCSLEKVTDFRNFNRGELTEHINGFMDMLDYTKRGKKECVRDLAKMQKKAMKKIMDYEIPEFRLGSMEEASKHRVLFEGISTILTDFGQNMQNLFNGAPNKDYTELRQAYEEVYPLSEVAVDEAKMTAFCYAITTPFTSACTYYEDGDYKMASVLLDVTRYSVDELKKKKVGELSILGKIHSVEISGNATDFKNVLTGTDEEYENYLNGMTGKYPGQKAAWDLSKQIMDRGNMILKPKTELEKIKTLSRRPFSPYMGLVEGELPQSLLELPEEKKSGLEAAFRSTFGNVYRALDFHFALEAGYDAFDMIMVGDQTMREYIGNKYDNEDITPQEKDLAFKLETMRYILKHPEGVSLRYMKATPDEQGKYRPVFADERIVIGRDIPNKDIVTGGGSRPWRKLKTNEARDFLAKPDSLTDGPLFDAQDSVKADLHNYFNSFDALFKKYNMDMFDCIYIGERTVNEIYAESYEDYVKKPSFSKETKIGILLAYAFNINLPIFITALREDAEGKLVKDVIPVTFPADLIPVKRPGTPEIVRARGESILKKRAEKYKDLDKARTKLYDAAYDKISNRVSNPFMDSLEERRNAVLRNLKFIAPVFSQQYEYIYQKMQEKVDEVVHLTVQISTYRLAAKMCDNPELKREFEEQAEQLKDSQVLKDYENYLQALELSVGIRAYDENEEYYDKMQEFIVSKTGVALIVPDGNHGINTNVTEISLGNAEDEEQNRKLAQEYIHTVYHTQKLKPNGDEFYAKYIIINGESANDLIAFPFQEKRFDPKKPEYAWQYEDRIAALVASALKEGKPVSFYVKNRMSNVGEVFPVPVKIRTKDSVSLDAATSATYLENQRKAHDELVGEPEILPEKYEERLAVLNKYKERDYRVWSNMAGFSGKGKCIDILQKRFFPDPVEVNMDKKQIDPDGEFTLKVARYSPINYVIMRLCEESLQLKAENKPGYTLDQIYSLEALKERKEEFAREYIEIMHNYDYKKFAENCIKGIQATIRYYDALYPLEELHQDNVDYDKRFRGKAGYIGALTHDLYQEITGGTNQEYIKNHYCDRDPDRYFDFQATLTLGADFAFLARCGHDGEYMLKNYPAITSDNFCLTSMYSRMLMNLYFQSNHIFGVDPLFEMAENVHDSITGYDDFSRCNAIKAIRNQPGFSEKLYKGTCFDNYFIDIDKVIRMYAGEMAVKYDDCVIQAANPEERERLYKDAIERFTDAREINVIGYHLKSTLTDRRNLFFKENVTIGMDSKPVFRDLSELSNEDLEKAEKIYDKIFARIMEREGVRTYLDAHPEISEFDLFKVGSLSLKQYLQKDHPTETECKALIVKLMSDTSAPLYRTLIRKNAAGEYAPLGQELIGGLDYRDRVEVEYPELKSFESYKKSIAGTDRDFPKGMSDREKQQEYDNALLLASGKLFDLSRLTSKKGLNAKGADGLEAPFVKMKTMLGPKAVFVTNWSQGDPKIYNKTTFVKLLPDMYPGADNEKFDEDNFSTLAFLATQVIRPDEVQLKDPDFLEGYMEGFQECFKRHQYQFITGFRLPTDPDIGERDVEILVAPARKKVNTAIQNALEENPDYKPLAEIIAGGLKGILSNAKATEDIFEKKNVFDLFTQAIKKTDDILNANGNEGLKNEVLSCLSNQEKEEIATLLEIRRIKEEYLRIQSENKKQKAEKPEVKPDEKLEDILLRESEGNVFLEITQIWKDHFRQFTSTEPVSSKLAELEENKKTATSGVVKEAIECAKLDFIKENNISIPDELKGRILGDDVKNQRTVANEEKVKALVKGYDYILDKLHTYMGLMSDSVFDEEGNLKVQPEEYYKRQEDIVDVSYLCTEALKKLLTGVDDSIIDNAAKSYNKKFEKDKNGKVRIFNKEDLIRDFLTDKITDVQREEFLKEILIEMARNSYRVDHYEEGYDSIRLPKDVVAEEGFAPYQEHPLNAEVQAQIQELNKQIVEIQNAPVAAANGANVNAQANEVNQENQEANEANQEANEANQEANEANQEANEANQEANEANQEENEVNPEENEVNQEENEVNPVANEANPEVNEANPEVNEANPEANEVNPVVNDPNPVANAANPVANEVPKAVRIAAIQKQIEDLRKANELVVNANREIVYGYYTKRGDVEKLTNSIGKCTENDKKVYSEFRNGALVGLCEKNRNVYLYSDGQVTGAQVDFLKPEFRERIQDLKDHPVVPESTHMEAIKGLVNLLNESGLVLADGMASTEEQYKIYSFAKLLEARTAIENAVNSKDYNVLEQLNRNYEELHQKYTQLYDYIKEHFKDLHYIPGNVESSRNSGIPPEFAADIKTSSILNSAYLLANHLKLSGLSFDEFMANPVKGNEKVLQNCIEKFGFDSVTSQYATVAEFFNACTIPINELGKFEVNADKNTLLIYRSNGAGAGTSFERTLELVTLSIADPLKRDEFMQQNRIMTYYFQMKTEQDVSNLSVFADYYTGNNASYLGRKAYERIEQGIKCALLEGGPIQKKHMSVIHSDADGVAVEDSLNYEEVLRQPNRYEALRTTYLANLPHAKKSRDGFKKCMESVLFDYLEAHQEDVEKEEYKQIEQLAFNAGTELGISTNRALQYMQLKERVRNMKERILENVKPDEQIFKDRMEAHLDDLKEKTKEYNLARENHQDLTDLSADLERIRKEIRDEIDNYRIDLNMAFQLGKLTVTYLKNRNAQLGKLYENPRNTDYFNTPKMFADEGQDRQRDFEIVTKRSENKRFPEHLKDLNSFKQWFLTRQDRTVFYDDELTTDEWNNMYDNEIRRWAKAHVALPEGVSSSEQLLVDIDQRNEKFKHSLTDEKLISSVVNDTQNVLNDVAEPDQPNGFVVIENNQNNNQNNNQLNYQNSYQNALAQLGQQLNEEGYLDAPAEVVQPNPIQGNPVQPEVPAPQGQQNVAVPRNQQNVAVPQGQQNVAVPQGQPNVPAQPVVAFKSEVYQDIANIVASGIVANRGNVVPGGNMNRFIRRIANDPQFKAVINPILQEVRAERAAGNAENEWSTQLNNMLQNRTIVSAYAIQKSNPEANGGVKYMVKLIADLKLPKEQRKAAMHIVQRNQANNNANNNTNNNANNAVNNGANNAVNPNANQANNGGNHNAVPAGPVPGAHN